MKKLLILTLIMGLLHLFSCKRRTPEGREKTNENNNVLVINYNDYDNYVIFKGNIDETKKAIKEFVSLEKLDTTFTYKIYPSNSWNIVKLSPSTGLPIYFNLIGAVASVRNHPPCFGLSLHKQNNDKDYYILYHPEVYPEDDSYENIYGYINDKGAFYVNSFDVAETKEGEIKLDSSIPLNQGTDELLQTKGFDIDILEQLDKYPHEEISF